MTSPQVAAPTTEIGYSNDTSGIGWLQTSEAFGAVPAWPLDLPVYERMRSEDAQPAAALRAVVLPLLSTQWNLDATGCREKVAVSVATNMGIALQGEGLPSVLRTRDRFSWHDHLRHACTMFAFGHSYFEQVYRPLDDGSLALRKLAWRPPMTISKIHVARDGGLVGISQHGVKQMIPTSRLVSYVNEREGSNWRGRSLFRSALKNQRAKDLYMRTDLRAADRTGTGLPVYEMAEGETDPQFGLDLTTKLRSGDSSGVSRPHGSGLELLGVKGVLPDMQPRIEYQDRQIFASVLLSYMSLGGGQGPGSYALGAVQAETFTNSLQSAGQQLCDTTQQHVIEDFVDVNFGPDEPAPRLVFERIGSHQAATAQALKLLVEAGILRPDLPLEEAARQSYGLPPKQSDPQTGAA